MLEHALAGGQNTAVVKIDNTVRRTQTTNADFVHQLLLYLEENEYAYSPRFLGIDEQGREILSFIRGQTAHEFVWTESALIRAIQMIKEFHDLTENSHLAGQSKVVCHCDLAPWNIICNATEPIGFIDFDGAQPGDRSDDLAYFFWTTLELGNSIAAEVQAEIIKDLCDVYGFADHKSLFDSLLQEQQKVLTHREYLATHSSNSELKIFSAERVIQIKKEIDWVKDNRQILESAFAK